MSEIHPLATLAVPGESNAVPEGIGIGLAERRPASFIEIGLWEDTAKLRDGLAKAAGCSAGPKPGQFVTAPGLVLASGGAGRYFAIGQAPDLVDRLSAVIDAEDGAVIDLSHGRVGVRVSGAASEALVQKGLAFDLSTSAFPPGSAVTGPIHHMTVTVLRLDEETFDLFAMTSFAGSLWHWVTDSAVEFGWQVSGPVDG